MSEQSQRADLSQRHALCFQPVMRPALQTLSSWVVTLGLSLGASACGARSELDAQLSGASGKGWCGGVDDSPCAGGMKRSVLAVGADYACAIVSGGGVKCWGSNVFGTLGDGSDATDSASAVDVTDLSSGVVSLSAGMHTCAVTESGGLKCWGDNFSGQLGNPDASSSSHVPVDVVGLPSRVVSVSTGFEHTCAVTDTGALLCWGRNEHGQIGNGDLSPFDVLVPTPVQGLSSGVVGVAAGYESTCAITSGGVVKCWGSNDDGQLGKGSPIPSDVLIPTDVVGLPAGVVSISRPAGRTCAITDSGVLACWGTVMLGNGNLTFSPDPIEIEGEWSTTVPVAAGGGGACAVTAAGALKCWGINGSGELGDGSTVDSPVPVPVKGYSSGVVAFGTGTFHACAVASEGGVQCWGSNTFHALGDGTDVAKRTEPAWVDGL